MRRVFFRLAGVYQVVQLRSRCARGWGAYAPFEAAVAPISPLAEPFSPGRTLPDAGSALLP